MREKLFIPKHNTNVLPLRWLANYIFHPISMVFFRSSINLNEDNLDVDLLEKSSNSALFMWKLYNFFDKPYSKWGTYYEMDPEVMAAFKQEVGEWSDYDEYGSPYWHYWWHEDPETGDGWRLIGKDQLTSDEMQTIFGVYSEEDIDRID